MNKAKFYLTIRQYFSSSVVGKACGAPVGSTISGTDVPDYRLLCITEIAGTQEVSLWISNVDKNVPNAEIRLGEVVNKPKDMLELEFLLTFPMSNHLLSFKLDEKADDIKLRLQAMSLKLDSQVEAKIVAMIDAALNDFLNL